MEENEIDDVIEALQTRKKKTERGNVEVRREGEKIVIPANMSNKQAIVWLQRKEEEENKHIAVVETVYTHPLDGAIAFMKALKQKYGWTNLAPTPGFFGPTPPYLVSVQTGVDEMVQVPWGRVEIPGVKGYLQTGYSFEDGRWVFQLSGEIRQGDKDQIHDLANLTRAIARNDSIYKGKAIRVNFAGMDDDFNPMDNAPKFMDTRKTQDSDLIFPAEIQSLVQTTLFTPIEKTEWCRQANIPLKRGILLEGPFGVGKTLTATVTAKKCERHGWTYIYIEDVRQLAEAVNFAKQYQPAVVFTEDIDRAATNANRRNEVVNTIMNTIDGVEIKNAEIMIVVTTNDVNNIEQAMLRPGRLDAVIPVRPPDAEAATRLIRLFAGELLADTEDLTKAGQMLAGRIPAVIREVVERSKLAAISRSQDGTLTLTGQDLAVAAQGMLAHLKLLEPKEKDTRSEAEKAAQIISNGLTTLADAVVVGSIRPNGGEFVIDEVTERPVLS